MNRAIALIPVALIAAGLIATSGSASTKSPVKVLCWNTNSPPLEPGAPDYGPADIRSAPRKCSLYRDGYGYELDAAHMRKLKWKHWGDGSTVAKGEFAQPMDIDDPWKPIKVRLKHRVERCGRTVYSKASFSSPSGHYGHQKFPIWTC